MTPQGFGHSIRQIHDHFGWMAKQGRKGHCAGALYRSAEFIRIPSDKRNGSRTGGRNIHIEHTVPVSVLRDYLKHSIHGFNTWEELYWQLLSRSICVAMSSDEELRLGPAGVAKSTHEAFTKDGRQVNDSPFLRYLPMQTYSVNKRKDFRIFNIPLRTEVNLAEFTFADHVRTLEAAAKLVNETATARSVFGVDSLL